MVFAMLGSLPCFAGSSLLIHLTDSTVIVCSLDKEPKMLFGDNTITLSSTDGSVGQWDFADVESWDFAEIDAVSDIKADKARILIEDSKLTVSGVSADKIAVYDLGGRLVTPSLNTSGNITSMSLNGLVKGTYLLKVGNNSVKFIVQ